MRKAKPKHLSPVEHGRHDGAVFFTVLALLTVVSFILPLRPTESVAEKRRLAQFPAFSAQALWSGDYFDDISLWFSDTFPGRDVYISVAGKLNDLHGLNRNRVVGGAAAPVESDDLDALLESVENPPEESPAPTEPPVETVDPNAEITEWTGFDEQDELDMYGNMVVLGNTIVTRLGFSKDSSDTHAAMMNRMGDKLADMGVRFFNLPVPTSVGVLLSSDMLQKIGSADQGKILRYMFAQENENVHPVNAFNNLIAHNSEYIYFNSDHHWTGLGAYYAYETFCQAAGFEPVPLSAYEEKNMGEFLGTYYFRVSNSVGARDEMIAYIPPGDTHMHIPLYPSLTSVIVDKTDANASVKYNCFIGGDNPIAVLTNDSIPDAPNCVVLKDSYGNPFTVYLTQHYHQVIVLDYRSAGITVSDAVKQYGAEDVILVQSISVSQTPAALGQLGNFLK